jgi:hypothetical protein
MENIKNNEQNINTPNNEKYILEVNNLCKYFPIKKTIFGKTKEQQKDSIAKI